MCLLLNALIVSTMESRKLTFSTKIPFGKHKGLSVYEVLQQEPSYITWLVTKWRGEVCYKVDEAVRGKVLPSNSITSSSKFRSPPSLPVSTENITFTVQKTFDTFPKGHRVSLAFLQRHYSSSRIQELINTIYLQ